MFAPGTTVFSVPPNVPIPTSPQMAMNLAEQIFRSNGTLASAKKRAIGMFLTELVYNNEELKPGEKKRWRKFYDDFGIHYHLNQSLLDIETYGNHVGSLIIPFDRTLQCTRPGCGKAWPFSVVADEHKHLFKFDFVQTNTKLGWEFRATCPHCKFTGPFLPIDTVSDDDTRVKIRHYPVSREIELVHDLTSGDTQYYWRIPSDVSRPILSKNPFHLERTPIGLLTAVSKNYNYRFRPGAVCHLKAPTLSGIRNGGWGIPDVLYHLERLVCIQMLRRAATVGASEYVYPFRVISLDANTTSGANQVQPSSPGMPPLDRASAQNAISALIHARQNDPGGIASCPFPVRYQFFGADLAAIAPIDLMEFQENALLNDLGYSVQLWKGDLNVQVTPTAGRIFETAHTHLPFFANWWLRWFTQKLSGIRGWTDPNPALAKMRIFDDPSLAGVMLEMFSQNKLPGEAIWDMIGRPGRFKSDQQAVGDEAIAIGRISQEVQDAAEKAGLTQQLSKPGGLLGPPPGQPGQPGQPQPGGPAISGPNGQAMPASGNSQLSLGDVDAEAQQIAQQLATAPGPVRSQQLRQLRQQNPPLHRLVRQYVEEIRAGIRAEGGTPALVAAEQQSGQQGAPQ